MGKKLKTFLVKNYFSFSAWLFLANCFFKIFKRRILYRFSPLNEFTYEELKKFSRKDVVILGSGETINELREIDYKLLKNKLTFAFGRWYFNTFVPNILFVEFSKKKLYWLEEFLDGINKRSKDYSETLIFIEISDHIIFITNYISKNLSNNLLKNVRLISSIKTMHDKRFVNFILSNKSILNYLIRNNILFHSRSSTFYGVSLAIFQKSLLILCGVDGYQGYFNDSKDFKKITPKKNSSYKLHSTSNPLFGIPTLDQAFLIASKYIPIVLVSKNTLLSKNLKVINLEEF